MPTRQQIERNLREQVRLNNWGVVLDRWPHKLTYYTQDGRALPNLPADPWSMERYLARGFTLAPPQNPTEKPSDPLEERKPVVRINDADGQGGTKVLTPAQMAEANGVKVFCETCGRDFDKKKRPLVARNAHKRATGH